jgi:A/G-specific adenine glycosylase
MGKRQGRFLQDLAGWFERQKRSLPWRDDPSLYRVWISEIMLQQTTVAAVVPFFERFLKRFPDVKTLARAPQEDVLLQWAGLGYYSRARNLHRGAQQIVASGGFPQTREGWLEVPGVGPYTAGAILSIALDQPEAILDGNIERVLARVRRMQSAPALLKRRMWRLSEAIVCEAHRRGVRPSVINQALMELGATVCTPRNPKCSECPVRGACRAFACDEVELFPRKKPPKNWVQVREVVQALVSPEGHVFLERRKKGEWREGLWDLPVVVESGDGVRVSGAKFLGEVRTKYVVTRHKVERATRVYQMTRWMASEAKKKKPDEGWMSLPLKVPTGAALKRTLSGIRERFPEVFEEN